MPEYHAHSANEEGQRHGLVEHLRAVAELAREFSSSFGGGETAHYAGLWHDLGKFDPEFQRYLSGSRPRGPDHKGAGTRLACQHVKGGEKVYHCGTFCRRRLQTGLYLGGNQLSGGIPPELGNLANLTKLNLSGNQLSGEIPPELGNLANLQELYLHGNQLNGADLSRCSMSGADFTRAMIRDSMWIAANMAGANFDQASLHRSDFTLAKWDNTTRFPQGFDPEDIEFLDVGV